MSVFNDLIEELKEENLLEETFWDANRTNAPGFAEPAPAAPGDSSSSVTEKSGEFPLVLRDSETPSGPHAINANGQEFFRKRAMDEVSSLQMVEHVFTGLEREHMKITPRGYDDLEVKKALHRFIQISNAADPREISGAESSLYVETNNWFEALAKRDATISIANLRRFCEDSRPVLSSQALIALGRFYRNSPFSEAVRAKFDFVMTRLFSRDLGDGKRKQLFGKSETVGHIHSLYSTWESLSLFSAEEHRDAVVGAKARFDAFAEEAEAAESFDTLVASDFFDRVGLYKEEVGEIFFETNVLASAMDCNVRVGNRFIDLLRSEAAATQIDALTQKYENLFDSLASTAAGRTLLLHDVLNGGGSVEEVEEVDTPVEPQQQQRRVVEFERAPVEDRFGLFAVNKWLLLVSALVVAAAVGVYFWSSSSSSSQGGFDVAPAVNLAEAGLSSHLSEASHTTETLYAVTRSSWDGMSEEEQKAFLTKVMDFAATKNLKRVSLVNQRGRTVGFAAGSKVEVYKP